jgi:protocatechuate 3,4-dioxygenase beta subunit
MPLVVVPQTLSEITGPRFSLSDLATNAADLTVQHKGEPIGERIIVSGQVRDEDGRPAARTLVEVWQANAAGRYLHEGDQHAAPLDPNFAGCGAALTDEQGHYRFVTIRPGSYPWRNHYNAWRPAHIHFSLFGPAFATRLVTQMYFPDDPLLPADPIFNCVPDEASKRRLIANFDWKTTIPETALGYRFDIVLRGREQTPFEEGKHTPATASQTVGPFFKIGFSPLYREDVAADLPGERIEVSGRVLDAKGAPVPDACLEIWQADAEGSYVRGDAGSEAKFRGYGRVPTDAAGRFRFVTVKPGQVECEDGNRQAPHLVISVFMRGLLKRLVTRMYFPGEAANDRDTVLTLVEAPRRERIIARPGRGAGELHWDVILQGEGETVFLDC